MQGVCVVKALEQGLCRLPASRRISSDEGSGLRAV